VALGESVSACRNRQGTGMRRHMETVSEQCHRTEDHTGDNLTDHHHGGQDDDPQCASGILIVCAAQENVLVGQSFNIGLSAHKSAYLM